MKAPEKIYLRKRNKLPLEVVCDKWYETDLQNIYGSVEYTRTDAFIEKAWNWIEDNMLSSNQQDKSRFYYEQFINYMKGE
jgi:hypothetical protein